MQLPARGLKCKHLQCFDASMYLQMNEMYVSLQPTLALANLMSAFILLYSGELHGRVQFVMVRFLLKNL